MKSKINTVVKINRINAVTRQVNGEKIKSINWFLIKKCLIILESLKFLKLGSLYFSNLFDNQIPQKLLQLKLNIGRYFSNLFPPFIFPFNFIPLNILIFNILSNTLVLLLFLNVYIEIFKNKSLIAFWNDIYSLSDDTRKIWVSRG